MERTDIRGLGGLPELPELATVDVAFIGVTAVLPAVRRLLAASGRCIALVKPQFEVGAALVGIGGVVRDAATQRAVVERVATWCADHGWRVRDAQRSVLKGADGNQEYFLLLEAADPDDAGLTPDVVARIRGLFEPEEL
jgi:23S rRNA (cytidine1920-2'-O)/16S rRNA (cytidine1409-2'-O)-methyltransferase